MPIAGSGLSNGKAELPAGKAEKRRRKRGAKPAPKSATEAPVLPEAPKPVLETLENSRTPEAPTEESRAFSSEGDVSPSEPVAPVALTSEGGVSPSEPAAPVAFTSEGDASPSAPVAPVAAASEDDAASKSEPAAPAASTPASVQAIADAYGSYAKKSLERTTSFLEQLASTRSLSRALELQTEFAREAFETFVTESRKIRELHREFAKQRLSSLEGFVMGRGARHSR